MEEEGTEAWFGAGEGFQGRDCGVVLVMPAGRPSAFSEDIFVNLLDEISHGKSAVSACENNSVPHRTFLNWLDYHPDHLELRRRYARAKEESADVHAEEMVEIADKEGPVDENGHLDSAWVNQQRLRIDVRKWNAAKLKPKVYGDKVEQTHTGEVRFVRIDTGVPRPTDV